MARVIIDVMLKPEIHDPQGEAVLGACHRLGFGQVTGVRQGKRFEVEIDGPADEASLAAIAGLAGDLLANPVIEEFSVHAAELPGRCPFPAREPKGAAPSGLRSDGGATREDGGSKRPEASGENTE